MKCHTMSAARPPQERRFALVHCFLRLWLATFALSFPPWTQAAPPNDLCSGAIVIPRNGPFPHFTPVIDITTATTTGDPAISNPVYADSVVRSVWFTFTPASTAEFRISSCATGDGTATTADTVMGIYTSAGGCGGPFTLLGTFQDESCGQQAEIQEVLLADTRYFVLVWKYCESGDCPEDGLNQVQLKITRTPIPSNDTCGGAIPITVDIPIDGTTAGGANQLQISNAGSFTGLEQIPTNAIGRDVVYRFTAPETGPYSFRVSNYSPEQDLVLYASSTCPGGNPAAVQALASANRSQFTSAEEILCLPLQSNQTIYVIVDDAVSDIESAGSSFTLEATRCRLEREPNDSPIDAAPLINGSDGTLSSGIDRDFFSLGNYPPNWRAFVMVDGAAAGNGDFDLRITTYGDTLEYDDNNNDSLFRDDSPNIAGTPLPGTPAFAFIKTKDGRRAEPYRIHAVVQPPLGEAAFETEPNNSFTEASFAEQNYFYGTLDADPLATDVDVFGFNVTEGESIFLSLDGDPHRTNSPVNARLELLDANGNPIAAVDDNAFASQTSTNESSGNLLATSPNSPGEAITYRSPVEGTFYARVNVSPNALRIPGPRPYLLSISKNGRIGSDGLNHAPELTNVFFTTPVFVGQETTLRGIIWDIDLGDTPRLLVNWGDGTTNLVDFTGAGRIEFAIPHTYKSVGANIPVQLLVTDRSGGLATGSLSLRVRPVVQPARFTGVNVLPGNSVLMELEGTPQADYRIEFHSAGTDWQLLGNRTANASGRFTISDTTPSDTSRFYRAVAE